MSYFDTVVERRDAVKAEMDAILEAVATESRTDLTADETTKVDALVEESRSLDEKIEKLSAQVTADAKATEARAAVAAVVTPSGVATVTREARTYSAEAEVRPISRILGYCLRTKSIPVTKPWCGFTMEST